MTPAEIKYGIGIAFLIILIAAFFFQIRRIWRIRFMLKHFMVELQKLNMNLENIITYIHGKTKIRESRKSSQEICKNCMFRLTYVEPGTDNVFLYQCKLNQRKITLSDTCKRFQKDLQNTQI